MSFQVDSEERVQAETRDGVAIGVLLGTAESGAPLVAFAGGPETPLEARSTVALKPSDIGSQVALLFDNGDPEQPLIIGRIISPQRERSEPEERMTASFDGHVLTLNAENEIVLRCGDASITLTRAGKIILQGTYLLSRSSGVNKIKGGSVQIN